MFSPSACPPCADARKTSPLLAGHFLRRFQSEYGSSPCGPEQPPTLSPPVQEALQAWSWPGNVRELQNVMERAFLLCEDGIIRIRDLPADIRSAARPGDSPPEASPELP